MLLAVADALVGIADVPCGQMGRRLAELVVAALQSPATATHRAR